MEHSHFLGLANNRAINASSANRIHSNRTNLEYFSLASI